MITAGIDMGSRTIKILVLRDGEVVGRALALSGFDAAGRARELLRGVLDGAGLDRTALGRIAATGVGRDEVTDRDLTLTEVGAAARGACQLVPGARTVIDIGAEEGRALRCDGTGRVLDFCVNEKCAAGTGAFTEAMARALEVSVEELGPLSLKSTRSIPINTQCAVFAESEIVSMIHGNVAKEDMARAVHESIAQRVVSMVRRVGCEPAVVLVGGMARNVGFVAALKQGLELDGLHVPEAPEFCAALGAALAAAQPGPHA